MTGEPISLGLGAVWGYSGTDLPGPARAANAGAIPDTIQPPAQQDGRRWRATELRIHGVSGSNGPTMLEHPAAVQVAGDSITMFYRRWNAAGAEGVSVPWKLEAYSWGGLTEAPLAAAAWILLAPFMMFNVGQFMLPATRGRHGELGRDTQTQRVSRDRWHAIAVALLRLLALTATVQFALTAVTVLVNVLAYQGRQAHLPAWLGAYTQRSADVRVALATVAIIVVVAALWLVSVKTANRYEARQSAAQQHFDEACPLTQPSFWAGVQLVGRQRCLHAAAALAAAAIVVAWPAKPMTGFRAWILVIAGVALAAAVLTVSSNLVDRHALVLGGNPKPGRTRAGNWWCRGVLGVAGAALVASAFSGGWTDTTPAHPRTMPGLEVVFVVLLVSQAALLIGLVLVVAACARNARPNQHDAAWSAFLGGHLTSMIVALGLSLGGLLSALTTLFVSRLMGAPVPTRLEPDQLPAHALEIPRPVYAFAAAPIGLLVFGVVAVGWLLLVRLRRVSSFTRGGPEGSAVGEYYGIRNDDPDNTGSRTRVAKAWATARLTDGAPVAVLMMTLGMLIATIVALVVTSRATALSPVVRGVTSAESVAGLFFAALLVSTLRSAYKDPSKRKTIGALWDVGTFWPRAVHPFAPPCYAERAVPELVDRVRLLTGTVAQDEKDPAWLSILAHRPDTNGAEQVLPGPVLLTGYSQGAAIAPAVIAQLPTDTVNRVALLTLACPARRLYGRAFPAYFGLTDLAVIAGRLSPGERPAGPPTFPTSWERTRWRNAVRRTDYIGSWVCTPEDLSANGLADALDQPSWDPPVISADAYPTPAPIHRHSDFWQDQRTTELGRHLIDMLAAAAPAAVPAAVSAAVPIEVPAAVSAEAVALSDIANIAAQAATAALRRHVETLHMPPQDPPAMPITSPDDRPTPAGEIDQAGPAGESAPASGP